MQVGPTRGGRLLQTRRHVHDLCVQRDVFKLVLFLINGGCSLFWLADLGNSC
jgi:hypothetical protein